MPLPATAAHWLVSSFHPWFPGPNDSTNAGPLGRSATSAAIGLGEVVPKQLAPLLGAPLLVGLTVRVDHMSRVYIELFTEVAVLGCIPVAGESLFRQHGILDPRLLGIGLKEVIDSATHITEAEYRHVQKILASRAPSVINPRRVSSRFLLSGMAKCASCDKPMTGAPAKSGRYSYYVCQTTIKQGSGNCDSPRLNSDRFEQLIIDQLRENVLTQNNIRRLVQLLDEEMDGDAHTLRQKLHTLDEELGDVSRRLRRMYEAIENSDLELADVAPRIRELRERQDELETSIDEAREALTHRRQILERVDTIAAYAKDMGEFLHEDNLTNSKAFLRSFIKSVEVSNGKAVITYTVPMPEDSPIGGSSKGVVDFNMGVRSTMRYGSAYGI